MLAMEIQNQMTLFLEYPGNKPNFALTTDNGKHADTIEKFPIYILSKQN
jgi:hypothetical protein